MSENINHDLKVDHTRDERARQHFVSGMRSYVLNDLAANLRTLYGNKVEPAFERSQGRKPADGPEVHKAMKGETLFKYYSSLRCNTQEMVWRSVLPAVERESDDLAARATKLHQSNSGARGTMTLDGTVQVPRYLEALDVHLMPGSYHEQHRDADVSQGAVYDNGLSVFAMGLLGPNMDDITQSVSTFFATRYPNFKPKKILDMGCTIGHSTLAWKDRYPDAEVHGIDVAAPCVRYGHARAQSYGVEAHFHQKDAEFTSFPDESFDVIYSCMFLHEVPGKNIRNILKEAKRMLKPGGVMLHYELPPNKLMSAYDGFYLDWDSFYNKEPFYKGFRDMDPADECATAGFKSDQFFNFVVPSMSFYGKDALLKEVNQAKAEGDSNVGRFADGVRWFTFGAWKN